MTQYIDKAIIVAEIEQRIKETESMQPKFDLFWAGQFSAFKGVIKILDTLEVKEVNLEKEIENYIYTLPYSKTGIPNGWKLSWSREQVDKIAKHFFEIGLQYHEDIKNAFKAGYELGIQKALKGGAE